MQQLLTNLSNTINKDLIIPLISNEIEFKEDKAKCNSIILKSKQKRIFAFSLDKNLDNSCRMFPFFNQTTSSITKVNDGIVFYLSDNQIYILLIELKTNNLGEYKKQLQAGKNFVLYLVEVLNNSFLKNYKIDEINIKCLVFSLRKTARKQGTKRMNIKYEKINGLNITELQCNDNHIIEKFI
jgi:hypothetical protein